MKVDITLTVGGNDVTIDYAEGKSLYADLKSLFEPGSKESMPYSVSNDHTVSDFTSTASSCMNKKAKTEPVQMSKKTKDTIEAIKDLEAIDKINEIDEDEIDEDIQIENDMKVEDGDINTEIVDQEIAERMKKMQEIINRMNP